MVVGHQIVGLKPGQLVFGRIKFAQQIGVSEQVLRSALKTLENLQQITIKSHSKYSVISITNWEKYQVLQPADNQRITSKQPADNHIQEIQELQEEDQEHLSSQNDDDTSGKPETKKSDIPFAWIMNKYNEICGASLKRAATLTDARKKNISKCWVRKVHGKLLFQSGDFWKIYFDWCLRDPHWSGEAGKPWKASLEFVTRHDIVDRVIDEMTVEGGFENATS